jgi:hypothetical protein
LFHKNTSILKRSGNKVPIETSAAFTISLTVIFSKPISSSSLKSGVENKELCVFRLLPAAFLMPCPSDQSSFGPAPIISGAARSSKNAGGGSENFYGKPRFKAK